MPCSCGIITAGRVRTSTWSCRSRTTRPSRRGVKTIFNNDADDSLGLGAGRDLSYVETYEGKLMEGKGAQGRYVRLFSNGNTHDDLNHYIEVEVYGRPLRLIRTTDDSVPQSRGRRNPINLGWQR